MKNIQISDVTMRYTGKSGGTALSFREKLELAKYLDRLCLNTVEAEQIQNVQTDSLLIKSLAMAVQNSTLAVPVCVTDSESIARTWRALQEAKRPRLQVPVSLSAVQMEYFYGKKAPAVLEMISFNVRECRALCPDVEFVAEDATRSEKEFLLQAVAAAVEAGAATVTLCDTAGVMLPEAFAALTEEVRQSLPETVRLAVNCSNASYLADACALAAVRAGADEIKVTACGDKTVSLERMAQILRTHADSCGFSCGVRTLELQRVMEQIRWICETDRSSASPFDSGVREQQNVSLGCHDSIAEVSEAVRRMGYDLSEEDMAKVYEAFCAIVSHKDSIEAKELDAIVASTALQVPPTYELESYMVNASNIIAATAHLRVKKNGQLLQGLCVGDGPIDAAFLAMEQIVGCHYELDDFQIQAVTEGREAMGETIVRLRARGKVYSGRGISTDIVGSGISAYISAVNKIVYEEAGA